MDRPPDPARDGAVSIRAFLHLYGGTGGREGVFMLQHFSNTMLGVLTLVLALSAGPAAVASDGAEPIGPEDAVRIALESHPMLRAAEESVKVAEAERAFAGSGYLPRVEITEDWVRSNNPVFVFGSKLAQGVFGPDDFLIESLNDPDPITNAMTAVTVRQNIWDAGRTDHYKRAARFGIEAAEHSRQKTRDEVVFGALQAFWDLVLAEEMLLVALDAEEAARANLSLAGELVEAGLAVPSDRMSAEVRMAEVEAMRIRAESSVEVAHAALLRAMGLESDRRFEPLPVEPRPALEGDALAQRIEQAHAQRADLLELDLRIEQVRVGVKAAKSGHYPEIGALARYEWNGDNLFGTDGDNWAIGLSARFTVFDGNATKSGTRRANAELSRLHAMREALRQGIRFEVEAAWAERDSARRRVDVAARALDRAEEALRIVRERYGEGLAMIVELLGAETAFTQAQANHAAAISQLWLAQAGLDLASGRDPSPSGPASGPADQS
jgi:outer membrane protein TolC